MRRGLPRDFYRGTLLNENNALEWRAQLQKWADYLDALTASNVVPLRAA